MAIVNTRQYRPQTNETSGANDPLSVASVQELAWAVNNAKAHALAHKTRPIVFYPALESDDGSTTTESVKWVGAPVYVPRGYRTFTWYLGAERFAGSDTDKTRWTLYCATRLYQGPDTMDTGYLGVGFQYEYADVAADAHDIYIGTRLAIARDVDGLVWPVLTATNDSGCRVRVDTLDMIPRL